MSFVGRLLRFLGLAAGHSEGERRLVDAPESATPDHLNEPSSVPTPLEQLDHARGDDAAWMRFAEGEKAGSLPDRAGHYPDLGDPGRGLRNDVFAQMERFRRGREPFPYQVPRR